MARAQFMSLLEAVDAIGNYIKGVAPDVWLRNRRGEIQAAYPVPNVFPPQAGAPALRVRWDGAPEETDGGLEDTEVPQTLFFEVRVTHPFLGTLGKDPYVMAQEQVLVGVDALNSAFKADPTFGGLIKEARRGNITVGSLVDEDGNVFYGGEIALICEVH